MGLLCGCHCENFPVELLGRSVSMGPFPLAAQFNRSDSDHDTGKNPQKENCESLERELNFPLKGINGPNSRRETNICVSQRLRPLSLLHCHFSVVGLHLNRWKPVLIVKKRICGK